MMTTSLNNYVILFVIMILFASCGNRENAGNTVYDQLFDNTLPVKELLKDTLKKHEISMFDIRQVKLSEGTLTGVLEDQQQKHYYFLVNLEAPQQVRVIPDPFPQLDFHTLTMAYANGKIFATSAGGKKLLYSYDYMAEALDSLDLSSNKIDNPSFISVYNNIVFSYGAVYGSCVYDIRAKRSICFNHTANTASYYYSTPSFPLSGKFNLVAGNRIEGDTITIYRLDDSLNIRARFGVKESHSQGVFKMITCDSGYAIANEQELIFMDTAAAKEKWRLDIGMVIDDIIKISPSELLMPATTLENGSFGPVYLQKIDLHTGTVKWKVPVGSSNYKGKHIAAAKNNRIIVTDQENIVIIDAADGKVLEKHPRNGNKNVSFNLITDETTGKNYYFNNGSVLYW